MKFQILRPFNFKRRPIQAGLLLLILTIVFIYGENLAASFYPDIRWVRFPAHNSSYGVWWIPDYFNWLLQTCTLYDIFIFYYTHFSVFFK